MPCIRQETPALGPRRVTRLGFFYWVAQHKKEAATQAAY
jgi:hypothetical protein